VCAAPPAGLPWSDHPPALASRRAAWPTVHLGEHAYVAHVIRHAKGGPPLASLHASDRYLAAGCGLGLPAALVAFETCRCDIASIVRRVSSAVDVEELMQNLREPLQGALGSFVEKMPRPWTV
jgi:hypothetical protein